MADDRTGRRHSPESSGQSLTAGMSLSVSKADFMMCHHACTLPCARMEVGNRFPRREEEICQTFESVGMELHAGDARLFVDKLEAGDFDAPVAGGFMGDYEPDLIFH